MNPALSRRGAFLERLLPDVIEEVHQKAVDPLFPPPSSSKTVSNLNNFVRLI